MAYPFSLPENFKIVNVAPSQVASAVTYDVIDCTNAQKVWFIITQKYAADDDITFSLVEGTSPAGSTTAVTATFPIWYDVDIALPTTGIDAMTKGTDAASYKMDTGAAKDQMCVIEWDPSKHTSGYSCIGLADTNGHASNYVTAIAIIAPRYPQATPLTAV